MCVSAGEYIYVHADVYRGREATGSSRAGVTAVSTQVECLELNSGPLQECPVLFGLFKSLSQTMIWPSHLRKKFQFGGFRHVCWGLSYYYWCRRAQLSAGNTTLWVGGPVLHEKPSDAWACSQSREQPCSTGRLSFLIDFPPWHPPWSPMTLAVLSLGCVIKIKGEWRTAISLAPRLNKGPGNETPSFLLQTISHYGPGDELRDRGSTQQRRTGFWVLMTPNHLFSLYFRPPLFFFMRRWKGTACPPLPVLLCC